MGAPAASPGVKLALDHHYSPQIAVQLRKRRCDVIAIIESGWEHEDDGPLLALCATESRTLLTNNVADFTVIARRWALQGRHHAGLIFTSDASMPRGRDTIGRYVSTLQTLIRANPGDDGFTDRIHWLGRAIASEKAALAIFEAEGSESRLVDAKENLKLLPVLQ